MAAGHRCRSAAYSTTWSRGDDNWTCGRTPGLLSESHAELVEAPAVRQARHYILSEGPTNDPSNRRHVHRHCHSSLGWRVTGYREARRSDGSASHRRRWGISRCLGRHSQTRRCAHRPLHGSRAFHPCLPRSASARRSRGRDSSLLRFEYRSRKTDNEYRRRRSARGSSPSLRSSMWGAQGRPLRAVGQSLESTSSGTRRIRRARHGS
jgi:hypothetical protein